MNIFFILIMLCIGLVGGQITALSLTPTIRVSLLDVVVFVSLFVVALGKRTIPFALWQRNRFIPKMWLPIILFFGVMLFSRGDIAYIVRWLMYVALYWVAADAIIPPNAWRNMLMASGIGITLLGFVQYVLYPDLRNLYYLGWDPHYQRLFSSLLDPNFAGIILVFTLFAFTIYSDHRAPWYVFGGGVGLTLLALVLTYSRSSLVASVIGFFVWGILTRRHALVTAVGIGLFLIFVALPKTGEGRNMFRTVSSNARIDTAMYAISVMRKNPVFGQGIMPHAGIDASMLFVGASTGSVGLVVYGWMIVSLFQLGKKGLENKKTHEVSAGYIGILVAALVHSIFVNSLFYPWVMAWIWIWTGALEREVYG